MEKKFLRIGEVGKLAGLTPKTIRYYEEAGVLPAPRRGPAPHGAGYRLFLPGDIYRLTFVRRARGLGLSLTEIKELLSPTDGKAKQTGRARLRRVIDQRLAAIEERIGELERLRTDFRRMKRNLALEVAEDTDTCCDPLCGPTTCR